MTFGNTILVQLFASALIPRSFPEMAMIAARNGCCAMIYPSAFNLTTGPLHCTLTQGPFILRPI